MGAKSALSTIYKGQHASPMPTVNGFQPLFMHQSAALAQQIKTLGQGLRQKKLPGWWLYHSAAQSQHWLDYHQRFSPSRAQASMQQVHHEAAHYAVQTMAEQICQHGVHVVGLGCGGGQKDANQLLALQQLKPHKPLLYAALDVSPSLALGATHKVTWATSQAGQSLTPRVKAHPLVLDFEHTPLLDAWLSAQESAAQCHAAPRLFTCHGMLPNLHHGWFLPYLRRLLRPQDALLLSANLSPCGFAADGPKILPQYNNREALTWLTAACHALGFSSQNLKLRIQARLQNEDQAQDSIWRIVAHASVLHPQFLQPFSQIACTLACGEKLQVFYSMRYTLAALNGLLQDHGLQIKQTFVWSNQEEAILYCTI